MEDVIRREIRTSCRFVHACQVARITSFVLLSRHIVNEVFDRRAKARIIDSQTFQNSGLIDNAQLINEYLQTGTLFVFEE